MTLSRSFAALLVVAGFVQISYGGEPDMSRKAAGTTAVVRTGPAKPGANPRMMLDGDTGDSSSWSGTGVPNSVEIELPNPVELGRVIVHPGYRLYAPNPSTECSPKEFVVQGWFDGEWRNLSPVVQVPRYNGQLGEFRVVADIAPTLLRRFRLWITALYDEGKRVHSPDKSVVAPEDRSVVIRELEWRTAKEVADAQRDLEQTRTTVGDCIREWNQRFATAADPVARVIRKLYGEALTRIESRLGTLDNADGAGLRTLLDEWERTERWLAPWQHCELRTGVVNDSEERVGELLVNVTAGETPHEFFPAKVLLDLRVVEGVFGRPVDPYVIEVVDLSGKVPVRCNSRFDRLTPGKGTLTWTLPERTHTRFVLRFAPRPDAPPETGMCTLGDGDHFYFDDVQQTVLPGDMWTCVFLDWDHDGRRDAIAGSWNDFCHLYRNVGTPEAPAFSEYEHFLIIDETEEPLAANPRHHACAFSMIMPIDFDGDGYTDLFLDRWFGGTPSFHRNLGGSGYPVVSRGRKPVGLSRGKMAFGDLTGDGIADALVVIHTEEKDTLRFHAGEGLDTNGAPRFKAGCDLPLAVNRAYTGKDTTLALADTDSDGDLDLYIVGPPYVWQHENKGTPKAFDFGEGKRIEYAGKPLDIGFYYPSISWSDYDADGDLDLTKLTGGKIYPNAGSPTQVVLGKPFRAPLTRQNLMPRSGLRCQAMLDWDGDGDLDHLLPHSGSLDLQVSEWQEGFFRRVFTVPVDPNKKDWYGCPDPTEYEALYALLVPFDWDGDGDVDLFLNSEHGWRFGYLHYYENLGDNRFAPEVEWRPGGGTCKHVRFVEGRKGQAALIDEKTFLDYLSYRTEGSFDPGGGTVRFWFKPAWGDATAEHTFFYTAPTPAVNGVRAELLRRYYAGQLPDLKIPPPFALSATEKGTLCFQAGPVAVESVPLTWGDGIWHRVEASWGRAGLRVTFDGAVVAETGEAADKVPCGKRMHIGSHAWMGVQREREYPSRWCLHPTDFSRPACGVFDDFEILDRDGHLLFALPFDGNADSTQGVTGNRLTVGYRCTPGFADLNADGHPDMIMMLSDGRRASGNKPEHRDWGKGQLYLFPGTQKREGAALPFAVPVPITLSDGSPLHCHIRTKATPVDWDGDGLIDLITSTEDHGGATTNRAVDLFRNVGTPTRPVFAPREPMTRLNGLLNAQHDVKVNAVDLTGNGQLDLVTSTDPGTCVFYRSFLDEEPVRVQFEVLRD